MDFGYLLELAKNNTEKPKVKSSFSTQVSVAKKEKRPSVKGDAIRKFLEKQDDEKKKIEDDELKKKRELMALRLEDQHYKKRVNSMLKRTKGANKSVLEEAKDLITMGGEEQCDDDDYGYESNFGQQMFSKLKDKYSTIPEDERLKFTKTTKRSIEEIKARVKQSLQKEEEEDLGIRKRRRKKDKTDDGGDEVKESSNNDDDPEAKHKKHKKSHKEDDGFINDGDEYQKFKKKRKHKDESSIPVNVNVTNYVSNKHSNFKYDDEKKKKSRERSGEKSEREEMKPPKDVKPLKKSKPSAPPPMSFEELMKVAQNKKMAAPLDDDPMKMLIKKKKELEKEKGHRPMSEMERELYEEEQDRKRRRKEKEAMFQSSKLKAALTSPKNNLPKGEKSKLANEKDGLPEPAKSIPSNLIQKMPSIKIPKKPSSNPIPKIPSMNPIPKKHTNNPIPKKSAPEVLKKPSSNPVVKESNSIAGSNKKTKNHSVVKNNIGTSLNNTNSKVNDKERFKNGGNKTNKPFKVPREREVSPPRNNRSKDDERRRKLQELVKKKAPKVQNNRIDSESDSEYDSEMDDFIDDGDEGLDYSSEISKLFKYDKSKFKDVDEDDLSDMETGFSQVEKEERISAKIGLQEDLQDIKAEEEARKRKLQRKKLGR